MTRWIGAALLVVLPAALSGQQPARVPADQAGGEWLVEGAGRSGDVKIDTFLGRRSLWLRNSTQAIKSGTQLVDGMIEFDVAPMDHADFVAIVFRRKSLTNHENVYLRPRSSGEFMAIQYAPRMNGSSTWQLYPQFTAQALWPRNQWTHVRVEVRGSRLEVFIGDGAAPVISVPRLRHRSTAAAEVAGQQLAGGANRGAAARGRVRGGLGSGRPSRRAAEYSARWRQGSTGSLSRQKSPASST